jgi:hypothetical protein
MTGLTLVFDTRQELSNARAACRRMLAAPLHLAAYQRTALTEALSILEAIGDGGRRQVSLDDDQRAALAAALHRLGHHTASAPATVGSVEATTAAVLAKLAPAAPWALPNAEFVQYVRLGYGDHHGLSVRCLDFTIDMPDRATFEMCLTDAIDAYEHFVGIAVAAAVGPLWLDLSTVSVGRDCGPLLRLRIPFTHQQRNGGDSTAATPIDSIERAALIDAVCAAGTACHADTILFTTVDELQPASHRPAPDQVATILLWWD